MIIIRTIGIILIMIMKEKIRLPAIKASSTNIKDTQNTEESSVALKTKETKIHPFRR